MGANKLVDHLLSAAPEVSAEAIRDLDWHATVAAVDAALRVESDDKHRLVDRLLRLQGKIQLAPTSSLPHSMSPKELLQFLAIQALDPEGRRRHRDALRKLAHEADSPGLRKFAGMALENL